MTELMFSDIFGVATTVAVFLSLFIEIAPIKVNPISWVLKYCGQQINADVKAEIDSLKSSLNDIDDRVVQGEIDRIRYEILSFSNSCRKKQKHTRDEFVHIIELNQKYHRLIAEKQIKNGQLDIEYEFIESVYKKCLENNSFLCANGEDDC